MNDNFIGQQMFTESPLLAKLCSGDSVVNLIDIYLHEAYS